MADFRLDRTAFSHQSIDAESKTKVFPDATYAERLRIAYYLNSVAYGYVNGVAPKMDKTCFS